MLISKRQNPKLRDQTNRLGLIETEEVDSFLAHVRGEFRNFETLLYDEVLEPRWEGESRKSGPKASARVSGARKTYSCGLSRTPSVNPFKVSDIVLVSVRTLAESGDMPDENRAALLSIYERGRSTSRLQNR